PGVDTTGGSAAGIRPAQRTGTGPDRDHSRDAQDRCASCRGGDGMMSTLDVTSMPSWRAPGRGEAIAKLNDLQRAGAGNFNSALHDVAAKNVPAGASGRAAKPSGDEAREAATQLVAA